MKERRLEWIVTVILASCAVVVTALTVRRELSPRAEVGRVVPPRPISGWQKLAVGGNQIGPAAAPVTIVEFSDFQCPFCAKFYRSVNSVRAGRENDIRVVFRNFPIRELHPLASAAALAAECAAQQGRFREYHDYLFEHQSSIPQMQWEVVARSVGVSDLRSFSRCLAGPDAAKAIERDEEAANEVGVVATPTVIVNGLLYATPPGPAELLRAVEDAIKSRRQNR